MYTHHIQLPIATTIATTSAYILPFVAVAMNLELSRLKSRSFSALAPPTLPCAPPTATVEMVRGQGGGGGKGKGSAFRQRSNRRTWTRRWAREVRPATSGTAVILPYPPSPWFVFEPDRLEPESRSNQIG